MDAPLREDYTHRTVESSRTAVRSSADQNTIDTVSVDSLRVLIAFDDLPAYKRAVRLLVRVAQQLGDGHDLRPLPWQFDVLESARWHALALCQAGDAEIMVVSTSRVGALPQTAREWLQACCAAKRESAALLVALLGAPDGDGEHAGPDTDFMRGLAEGAGWGFLSPPGARGLPAQRKLALDPGTRATERLAACAEPS